MFKTAAVALFAAFSFIAQSEPQQDATGKASNHAFRCLPHLKVVDHKPVTEGFVCHDIPDGSALHKAGILDKDIILSVDGKVLGEQPGASQLLDQIDHGEYTDLVIVRNGKKSTLHPATR